jgi:ankyrin repeat protein
MKFFLCRSRSRNSYNLSTINAEFERMKDIPEIKLDDDIMAFLKGVHSSFDLKTTSNPRGPLKRSLIHYAAMGDCSELLRFLLESGATKDDRDQNERTPLSWAAEFGSLTSAKILLKHGAKINSIDDMNGTPLSWLIHAGAPTAQTKATEAFLRKKGAKESAKRRRIFWKIGIKRPHCTAPLPTGRFIGENPLHST